MTMTQRSLAVLIVLNVALLAGLSVTVLSPAPAQAQFGGGRQYTMIAGDVTGRAQQAAIYVVDLIGGDVVPLFFNGGNDKFEVFDKRSIAQDMKGGAKGNR